MSYLVYIHIPYESPMEEEFENLSEVRTYIKENAVPDSDERRAYKPSYYFVTVYEIASKINVYDLMKGD